MPVTSDVHVDSPLTTVSIGRPRQQFVSDVFFPTVSVTQQSGIYFIYDIAGEARRQEDDARTLGSAANVVDQKYTQGTYICQGHALVEEIPRGLLLNADRPINLRIDSVETLMDKLGIRREIRAKALLDAALTGNQTDEADNGWNDEADGTPIDDINGAFDAIEDNGGARPNVMGMDSKVWRNLKKHPEILDRIVAGGSPANPADITPQGVAALFDLDQVVVSSVLKNTAVEGQDASDSRVWSDDVYIAHVVPRPTVKTATFAMKFLWGGMSGAQEGNRIKTWFEDRKDIDVIELESWYDQVIVAAARGFRISNVTQ